MNRSRRVAIPIVAAALTVMFADMLWAAGGPEPRFVATLSKEETPGHAVQIDVDITNRKTIYLVTTGPSFSDWAEPRLVGPSGEKKLTELKWRFASVGSDTVRLNTNQSGGALAIDGKTPEFGIFVHSPSMIAYDLPPGYTRFRARAGLDHGPSNNITFAVYVDNPLLDKDNAALWEPGDLELQRDLAARPSPSPYVEMINGDRLPGEVVGYVGNGDVPSGLVPHWVVQPRLTPARLPASETRPVRVIETFVRRVVWQSRSQSDDTPGTVFFVDGREVSFRSVQFTAGSLRLLTKQGIMTVATAEIAEIHLPRRDPWQSYFDEAAILSPDGQAPIVRFETADGAKLTGSTTRCSVRGSRGPDNSLRWWSVVQPAWSLDPLEIADDTVLSRARWSPHEVPLTHIPSTETRSGVVFSRSVPSRQADRNTQGDRLQSGEALYRWGYGVHAPSQLAFPLHGAVAAVRMRVGLDRIAGEGGCARARIYVDSTQGTPRWESPLLIGSAATVDTGTIRLPGSDAPTSQLILQADPAITDHPPSADPMDIRDTLDWLEPVIELDAGRLQTELAERKQQLIAAWQNWTVGPDPRAYRVANYWDGVDPSLSRFRMAVVAEGKPLTLTRQITADEHARFLIVSVSRPDDNPEPVNPEPDKPESDTPEPPAVTIEVRVDGAAVAEYAVPSRNSEQSLPLVVPLAQYEGTAIKLEIVQSPSDSHNPVYWEGIELSDHDPAPLPLLEDDG